MKGIGFLAILCITGTQCENPYTAKQTIKPCPNIAIADVEKISIFPTTHPLNTDISLAAIDEHSDSIIPFISGAPNNRWDNDDLQNLKKVKATNFEVIEMGEIIRK